MAGTSYDLFGMLYLTPRGSTMRRIFLSLAFVMLLAGCGDQTDSKSGENNVQPSPQNNTAVDNGTPNNVTGNNDEGGNNALSLMDRYGTEGPVDDTPKSSGGNALCNLDSIKSDDLEGDVDASVPAQPWGSAPVADDPARCGNDAETTVWRLNNCERMARDLPPFECDLRLVWLGRAHSQDMIDRGFFSHDNPDNESPFERMAEAGVQSSASGENIAQNPTAEGAHLAWMDSGGHRGNMLGSYSHIGCGFIGNLYTTGFITD